MLIRFLGLPIRQQQRQRLASLFFASTSSPTTTTAPSHLVRRYHPTPIMSGRPSSPRVSPSTAEASSQPSSTPSTFTHRSRKRLTPPIHRGLTSLDRSLFSISVPCLALGFSERDVGSVLKNKIIQGSLLNLSKTRAIEFDPENEGDRLVLFDVERFEELPEAVRKELEEGKFKYKSSRPWTVEVGYDHWTASEIFDSILPLDLVDQAPTAFTSTGHIAHVNLRDSYLPYKNLIGQVILDKNKNILTVVNKLDTIDSTFRFFAMEVLAGEERFITTAHESGYRFNFDFSKVYWNSRLSHEHERIVETFFKEGEVVADVMAGVGPFAIPAAAKKRCFVLGNDLNPESAKWMEVNRVDNKVTHALRVSNIDGREFIRTAQVNVWKNPFEPLPPSPAEQKKLDKERRRAREAEKKAAEAEAEVGKKTDPVSSSMANLSIDPSTKANIADTTLSNTNSKQPTPKPKPTPTPKFISHFVMNLPGSALEFLDAYSGSYAGLKDLEGFDMPIEQVPMPLIHTHCFTREEEGEPAERDICQRASSYLGHTITPQSEGYHLHYVRKVAPNKDMYCITFRLPREVAFAQS